MYTFSQHFIQLPSTNERAVTYRLYISKKIIPLIELVWIYSCIYSMAFHQDIYMYTKQKGEQNIQQCESMYILYICKIFENTHL